MIRILEARTLCHTCEGERQCVRVRVRVYVCVCVCVFGGGVSDSTLIPHYRRAPTHTERASKTYQHSVCVAMPAVPMYPFAAQSSAHMA
jgi:hypothetical protein